MSQTIRFIGCVIAAAGKGMVYAAFISCSDNNRADNDVPRAILARVIKDAMAEGAFTWQKIAHHTLDLFQRHDVDFESETRTV